MLDLSHSSVSISLTSSNARDFSCDLCGATNCSTYVFNNTTTCQSCFKLAQKTHLPTEYVRYREWGANTKKRVNSFVYYLNDYCDQKYIYLSPEHPLRRNIVVDDSGKISRDFYHTINFFSSNLIHQ